MTASNSGADGPFTRSHTSDTWHPVVNSDRIPTCKYKSRLPQGVLIILKGVKASKTCYLLSSISRDLLQVRRLMAMDQTPQLSRTTNVRLESVSSCGIGVHFAA